MLTIKWEVIEDWQKLYGVDDYELAEQMGYNYTTLWRAKNGKTKNLNRIIQKLMEVTGLSFEKITFWDKTSTLRSYSFKNAF
jgi:hypothetical protein